MIPTRVPGTAQRAIAILICGWVAGSLVGCSGDRGGSATDGTSPFVFRALDLRQQDPLGRPSWSLSSPEARYDIDSRMARAQQPSGTIFRDGKPAYRLTANIGTVLNDGMVVLLEGDIRLEQLGPQPLMIRASRGRWLPRRQLLELDRHPEAVDDSNRITARRARYRFDQEQLELGLSPRIEHWSQRFDPFRLQDRGRPDIVLDAGTAHWFPRDGRLEASGPLRGRRQAAGPAGAGAAPTQSLQATALRGNTREQRYSLIGPIQMRDPSQDLTLLARQLEIDGPTTTIRTAMPQAGQQPIPLGQQTGSTGSVLPPPSASTGCLVLQRQTSLQADACLWNWQEQILQATGNVVLRRQEHRQESRGSLLVGRLGDQGRFRLSAPGARVVSRFQAPAMAAPPPPPPRAAPEPIRL